jgi:hypothetical protein
MGGRYAASGLLEVDARSQMSARPPCSAETGSGMALDNLRHELHGQLVQRGARPTVFSTFS